MGKGWSVSLCPPIPWLTHCHCTPCEWLRRQYLVTNYVEFWQRYRSMKRADRCYYELIAEDSPCKMYFDLEFSRDFNPQLVGKEEHLMETFKSFLIRFTANELGIGPMGFGGKTTLLGVKIGAANRVPASYFVSVSYMCWAFRRHGVTLASDGEITGWLY